MELTESSAAQLATVTPVADWPVFGLGYSIHKKRKCYV
jgi:hypothetical protein